MSYSSYNPALTRPLDRVRFALGDTETTPQSDALLSDQTILAALTTAATTDGGTTLTSAPLIERRATLALVLGLMGRYAQEPDTVQFADGTQVSFKNRLSAWQSLARSLQDAGTEAPGLPARGMRSIRPTRGASARAEFG